MDRAIEYRRRFDEPGATGTQFHGESVDREIAHLLPLAIGEHEVAGDVAFPGKTSRQRFR
jgi:hypothetical protein